MQKSLFIDTLVVDPYSNYNSPVWSFTLKKGTKVNCLGDDLIIFAEPDTGKRLRGRIKRGPHITTIIVKNQRK